MNFGEKTISSTPIFEGRILKLKVDEVILPDGSKSKREIVEHRGAVAILAVDEQNNIWMVRQYRKPVEQVLLEIPAGTLEENEEPLECAKRELLEETGLAAGQWDYFISYFSAPGFCNEKLHLYIARDLKVQQELKADTDEFIEITRIPLPQAYQKVMAGEIMDGKSIIAIQYAYQMLTGK